MKNVIGSVKKHGKSIALVVAASSVSFASSAAIDVSTATTAITTDGGAAIAAIGGALIGLAGTAVVYKWIKAAIFG
ncbi:major capsid protein [Vibrio atlanticus]|uniref:major capsid protein n=1 Tax=Vibrio atlanticus TaxID=693153 RepID=UPI003550A916